MRDLYAETTARIVAALVRGAAPWVKPWSPGIDTLPMSGGTRRLYRGVNVLLLELEAARRGYPLQRWLTYRQAREPDGQVRRGERGTTDIERLSKAVTIRVGAQRREPDHPVARLLTKLFSSCQDGALQAAQFSSPALSLGTPSRSDSEMLRTPSAGFGRTG